MKTKFAIAAALCVAGLGMDGALAQQVPLATADAIAHPAAATPALTYQSPLAGFVPLKEPAASPASTWRDVNRAVGSYDSMAATVDDMPGMAMPTAPESSSMPMQHDMKSMPMQQGEKPMPMHHDMKSMPMKPATKSTTKSTTKPAPKGHDMKSMQHDMPMNMDMDMDSMPGMKKGMK